MSFRINTSCLGKFLCYTFSFFLFLILEHIGWRSNGGQGERQADSPLSVDPDTGLNLMTPA